VSEAAQAGVLGKWHSCDWCVGKTTGHHASFYSPIGGSHKCSLQLLWRNERGSWEAEDVALRRPKKLEHVAHIWSQSIECWSYTKKLIQYCMCMRIYIYIWYIYIWYIYISYIYIYMIYIYISYMAFQKYPKLNMTKQKVSNSSLIWAIRTSSIIVLADLSSPGKNFCDALNFSVLVGY